MNVEDGFEATLRGQQKRRILMAVAGGTLVLLALSVGLLVSALGRSSEAPAAAAPNPDHQAMLKASIRAQRSALSQRQVARVAAPAPVAKAEKPAPVAKAKAAPVKARKSSAKHVADEDGLKRPSIADPVSPPPAKTVASSAGGTRGDEPSDPN